MGVVQKINGCHSNRSEESPLSDIEPLPPRSRHLRFQDQDLSDRRGGSPQPMSSQVLAMNLAAVSNNKPNFINLN